MRRAVAVAATALGVVLGGCTGEDADRADTPVVADTSPADPADSPTGEGQQPSWRATPSHPSPDRRSARAPRTSAFEVGRAMADVRLLAERIGPRLATDRAYRRAARVVERRLVKLGYDVRREPFRVPAGDSWGVPVEAGRSANVVAEPPGFDATRPHVVLGAHLDTVAVSPGAEDNASGVALLLELARLAATEGTRPPAVLVAFGAEEPRGQGDDMHHFGSQHHVRRLAPDRLQAVRAMVSLDRVGVGSVVPVCTGPLSPSRVQRELVRTARRIDVPAHPCENTASDHWSFEKAGVAVARLGSTPYEGYHSSADVSSVVRRAQLRRTGRLAWAWLR